MKSKKNLSRKTVRLLRKVQKFLLEEPRRFDMREGIISSDRLVGTILEQPPCGTACCIAGAAYIVDTGMSLEDRDDQTVGFGIIENYLFTEFPDLKKLNSRLFYVKSTGFSHVVPGIESWPQFYTDMYAAAKTPLERAIAGVARIEHLIATDGLE